MAPSDYLSVSTILNFDECATSQCTEIMIVDDEIPENTESFNVGLGRTPGLDSRITLNPVDGVIQIDDVDGMCYDAQTTFIYFGVF